MVTSLTQTRLCSMSSLALVVALMTSTSPATAVELRVIGHATVLIGKKPHAARLKADKLAKLAAVTAAVDKVIGYGASQKTAIKNKIVGIAAQIGPRHIVRRQVSAADGKYSVAATYAFDDKAFRMLLLDQGIGDASKKARMFSVLAIMDEFMTLPRKLRAPLTELTVYSRDRGASFSGTSSRKHSDRSNDKARVNIRGNSGARTQSASSKSSSQTSVQARAHDSEFYKRLIRYQPQGGSPEKVSKTYNALTAEFGDYDVRVLDSDAFRSKHLKTRTMTLQQLSKSAELAPFIAQARSQANADFFLVGTSVIIDSGKNKHTGNVQCSGVMSVKVYSTASSELVSSGTTSESSSGNDINQCAANLAVKLAKIGGPALAKRLQDYWKRRTMFGREYAVRLVAPAINFRTRIVLTKALKAVTGVESVRQRSANATELHFLVRYKGKEPLDQAIGMKLIDIPKFANLDARADGTKITLCLGSCSELLKASK